MGKAVFPEKPAVRPLEGSDYELAQHFYFPATVEGAWEVVVHVAPGFRTDGASIPRLLWRVFGSPYDPDIFAAAIGHDALYRGRIVPRRDADRAFLDMMERNGVPERKRRLVYRGVRWFGWITWLVHTPESVAEARRYISLAFAGVQSLPPRIVGPQHHFPRVRGGTEQKTKGKGRMKNALITMTLAAIAAAMTGCTSSTSVEWGGKTAVRQPDGTVLVDDKGTPYYESGKNVYKDSNMLTKREERDLKVKANADGSYEAALGSRVNDVSENGIKMVTGGIEATTKLVSACAAAYATIAGGATADAATTVVSKMIGYFTGKGGDAAKATVSNDGNSVKVTDGKTTILCDKDGNCSDCSDGSCNP